MASLRQTYAFARNCPQFNTHREDRPPQSSHTAASCAAQAEHPLEHQAQATTPYRSGIWLIRIRGPVPRSSRRAFPPTGWTGGCAAPVSEVFYRRQIRRKRGQRHGTSVDLALTRRARAASSSPEGQQVCRQKCMNARYGQARLGRMPAGHTRFDPGGGCIRVLGTAAVWRRFVQELSVARNVDIAFPAGQRMFPPRNHI